MNYTDVTYAIDLNLKRSGKTWLRIPQVRALASIPRSVRGGGNRGARWASVTRVVAEAADDNVAAALANEADR